MAKKSRAEGVEIVDFLSAYNLATMTTFQCIILALDNAGVIELDRFRKSLSVVATNLGGGASDSNKLKHVKLARDLMGDLVKMLDKREPFN